MQRYLKPNIAEISTKVVDGEVILINLSNGIYYSMDSVGGFVWSLVEAGNSLDAISATVAQRYNFAEDTVKRDIKALAQQLLDEKLVIYVDGESLAGTVEFDGTPTPEAYTAPQLNKFDDMVDLFALDPPLPELSKLSDGD